MKIEDIDWNDKHWTCTGKYRHFIIKLVLFGTNNYTIHCHLKWKKEYLYIGSSDCKTLEKAKFVGTKIINDFINKIK